MKVIVVIIAIILSSCATTIPLVVKMPLPPELILPKINGDLLQCLTDNAYSNIVKRDKLQSQRRATLRQIIMSTH